MSWPDFWTINSMLFFFQHFPTIQTMPISTDFAEKKLPEMPGNGSPTSPRTCERRWPVWLRWGSPLDNHGSKRLFFVEGFHPEKKDAQGTKWMVCQFGLWVGYNPIWVVVSNILYFHPEPWGNDPIRLIFFRWVETTNQPCVFSILVGYKS